MAQVRYLGFVVGDGPLDATRETPAQGRFVGLREPLPVGTLVELEGAQQRVTRVDEGAAPGFWILPASAARPVAHTAGVPTTVEPDTTVKSDPPVIEMVADAEDEPAAPAAAVPVKEEGAPDPTTDDPTRGGKRKRRPKKTVLGR